MAMPDAVQGALRPSPSLTWQDQSAVAVSLANATLTGTIRNERTGVVRAVTGTLTVTDAAGGIFRWDYSAADVLDSGVFRVQFTATYNVGVTPARTIPMTWTVHPAQVVIVV